MILHIRNMESDRCRSVVKTELNKLGLGYKELELGTVELKNDPSEDILQLFDIALKNVGLELISDKKRALNEKILEAIYQLVYLSDDIPKPKISDFISTYVNCDYNKLSNIFKEIQGVTIEKYVISQKIERAKELIISAEHTLGDIAFLLQYSSVAHLTNQFKKETGVTPSNYREIHYDRVPCFQSI